MSSGLRDGLAGGQMVEAGLEEGVRGCLGRLSGMMISVSPGKHIYVPPSQSKDRSYIYLDFTCISHLAHARTCEGPFGWASLGRQTAFLISRFGGAMTRDNRPSEFGGHPGPTQPPPHELTAAEQLRLRYLSDPAEADDDPLEHLAEEHKRDGYSGEASL